jgi:ubiquitin-conjugating enzyme E2 J2
MHTPSGRFQPSTRLCLSISDFHPKSFNPAWEVSTILIGLLSFMTSEEMTTGSISATDAERKWATARTRWWNSTGGGSWTESGKGTQKGNVKAGDGGAKFRSEWPELDRENWKWMKENRIDPATGIVVLDPAVTAGSSHACAPGMALRRPSGSQPIAGAVVEGGRAVGEEGRSWMRRNRLLVAGTVIFTYVLIARLLGEGPSGERL